MNFHHCDRLRERVLDEGRNTMACYFVPRRGTGYLSDGRQAPKSYNDNNDSSSSVDNGTQNVHKHTRTHTHTHTHLVDGDGKADALRVGAHGRVHPHHLPKLVHEGPTAIARVDRGVGLDEVALVSRRFKIDNRKNGE